MSESPVAPPANASDGGTATTAVGGAVIGLAVVCVALRFYIRAFTKTSYGWDDWLILAAAISTLATAAILLWSNSVDPNGTWVSDNADPSYVYTPEDQFYLKLSFITSVLYFTIASTTKLGILLLYNRLFSVRGSFRHQVAVLCVLVLGFWVGCTVATLTNCVPLEWSWINGLADPRYCFNFNTFWMAAGACEVLLDILILALPIQVVLSLNLSTRRRWTIASIFLLGAFVVVTGLLKTIFGYVPGGRVPSYSRTEVWTTIHTGMAIVCACLPIFGPLVAKVANSRVITRVSNSIVNAKVGRVSPGQRASPSETYDVLDSHNTEYTTRSMSMSQPSHSRDVSWSVSKPETALLPEIPKHHSFGHFMSQFHLSDGRTRYSVVETVPLERRSSDEIRV